MNTDGLEMVGRDGSANIRRTRINLKGWLYKCSSMFICVFMNAVVLAQANPTLPSEVQKSFPGLTLHGESAFRFIGMKVYDIRLWAPEGRFAADKPFALELVYDMNFKGTDIARRSVDEKRGQGHGPEEKLERWYAHMARIFPDIKPGDTLIGVHVPGKEARFFTREKFIAAVPDAEFAQAFFDIWLSEKTSQPSLRKRLLEKK